MSQAKARKMRRGLKNRHLQMIALGGALFFLIGLIVIIAKKHKEDTWVFAVNSVMDPVTANITIPGCKEIRWYKENGWL